MDANKQNINEDSPAAGQDNGATDVGVVNNTVHENAAIVILTRLLDDANLSCSREDAACVRAAVDNVGCTPPDVLAGLVYLSARLCWSLVENDTARSRQVKRMLRIDRVSDFIYLPGNSSHIKLSRHLKST
jgi:hypothetical protein